MKNKKNIFLIVGTLMISVVITGCTNTTYADLNRSYNEKNGTNNRSMALDTIIATALYNNPDMLKKNIHKKTNSKSNIVSNTNSFTNTFGQSTTTESSFTNVDKMGGVSTTGTRSTVSNSYSTTQSQTKTNGRSKSNSHGVSFDPSRLLLP